MSCKKVAPYYSKDSDVYHVCANCTVGDNIEGDKLAKGDAGKRRLCQRCKQIQAGQLAR